MLLSLFTSLTFHVVFSSFSSSKHTYFQDTVVLISLFLPHLCLCSSACLLKQGLISDFNFFLFVQFSWTTHPPHSVANQEKRDLVYICLTDNRHSKVAYLGQCEKFAINGSIVIIQSETAMTFVPKDLSVFLSVIVLGFLRRRRTNVTIFPLPLFSL